MIQRKRPKVDASQPLSVRRLHALGGVSLTNPARAAGIGAAAIFIAAALSELVRIFVDHPWPGMSRGLSEVTGIVLAVLWAASAWTCTTHRQRTAVLPIVGAFTFLPHFVVTRAAGSPYAIGFLVILPVLVLLLRVAFGSPLHVGDARSPATEPSSERTGREIL